MNAFSRHVLRVAVATALLGGPATAMASSPTAFAGLSGIAPADMAQLTGGLEVGGLKIDLTARVRTYINDRLAATTEYRITRLNDAQQRLEDRLARANHHVTEVADTTEGHPPAQVEMEGTATQRNTRATHTARPDGGVRHRTINEGDGGVTTMTFDIGRNQLVSTIGNTANDRHIHQQINVDIKVSNFREYTSNIRSSLVAERIGRAVNGQ